MPPAMPAAGTPVYFALLPRTVLLDVAGPAEVFRVANKYIPGAFELHFCGPSNGMESGLPGLRLAGLEPLPERLPAHAIAVVAGTVGADMAWQETETRLLVQWLARRHAEDGFRLMTVCWGALLAAAAGLLHQRACTSHHSCLDMLARIDPAARVLDNRIFVEDGRVMSSAGYTAGIDLALHVTAGLCGPRVASAVAREMVVYLRRAGDDPAVSPWLEHRNHLHPVVHRIQDAIVQDPAAAWTAEAMARRAHTSSRHLARLFARHAGCSPLDYLHRIRVAMARELVRESDLSLENVAERSGFGSVHHMRRVWRKFETTPPGAWRGGGAENDAH
ncbi:GlxA family transcriptional regulator [Achromobacter aloeverae]|nr:helix-turn-helix domain-containing protein [Achromobacter aloeverae]